MNVQVGARLRKVRRARRLTLGDVEAVSGGDFKTSVLGAYERGERGLRVHRLMRLAQIYEVPPGALLPPTITIVPGDASVDEHSRSAGHGLNGADTLRDEQRFPLNAVL